MSRPTRDAITFAFIGSAFAENKGALHGLVPLFAVAVVENEGQIFEPAAIAKAVKSAFDLNVSPLVVTSMVPALVETGYLAASGLPGLAGDLYRCLKPVTTLGESQAAAAIERVFGEFREQATEKLRAHSLVADDEELDSRLLDALTTSEFLHLSLRQDSAKYKPGVLTLSSENKGKWDLKSEAIDFLCADFIQSRLEAGDSQDFELLLKASWGALISEVVIGIQRPDSPADFSGLTVFLDGPLLLDALDLGDATATRYALDLIALLNKADAKLATFSHVAEEMREVLRMSLANFDQGYQITGPLAQRVRADSKHVGYVRAALVALTRRIEELGVQIFDDERFEEEALTEHFSRDLIQDLRVWIAGEHVHKHVQRDLRDATSIAYAIRFRGGRSFSSLSQANSVFVTKNAMVIRRAGKFLASKGLIGEYAVPACVSDQQIAGVLWFCTGGGGETLTRLKLATNCADAVTPSVELIKSMDRQLLAINSQHAKEFEALVKYDRAALCLMRETLGVASFATADEAERILASMKQSTGELEREKYERELAQLRTQLEVSYGDEIRRREQSITLLDKRIDALTQERERDQAAFMQVSIEAREQISKLQRESDAQRDAAERARTKKQAIRDEFIRKVERAADLAKARVTGELLLLYFLVVYMVAALGLSAVPGFILSAAITMVGFWRVPGLIFDPLVKLISDKVRDNGLKALGSFLESLDD